MRMFLASFLAAACLVSPFSRAEDAPAAKLPIPAAAKLTDVEKTLRELFADDFKKTAPADKVALAQKLVQVGDASQDPAERYGTFAQAGTLAAQAGDLGVFLDVHAKLDDGFEPNPQNPKKAGLATLLTATRDPLVIKAVTALKTLAEKPDDPIACQNAGKFLVFVKGDWERGMALLTKAGAPDLRRAAELDKADPQETAAQIGAGDAWWDLGDKTAEKDEKRFYQERAAFWYRKAAPGLTGLAKIKIEKRVGSVEPGRPLPPSVAAVKPTAPPAATAKIPPPSAEGGASAATLMEGAPSDYEFTVANIGGRYRADKELKITQMPDEMIGAQLLLRRTGSSSASWLPRGVVNAPQGIVYAVIMWRYAGRVMVSEAQFKTFIAAGWEPVPGPFVAEHPPGDEWIWTVYRRRVTSGPLDLPQAGIQGRAYVFVIKADAGPTAAVNPTGAAKTPASVTLADAAERQIAGMIAQGKQVTIDANNVNGYPLGPLKKGAFIVVQYVSGKWKEHGRLATDQPDAAECNENSRMVIAERGENDTAGTVLQVVPAETVKRPFVFTVPSDSDQLILRIKGRGSDFKSYPGSVRYKVFTVSP